MAEPYQPLPLESLATIDKGDIPYDPALVEVIGIVTRQAGFPQQEKSYEIHAFSFVAWRQQGLPLASSTLFVHRPVPKGSDYFRDFPNYTLLRCQVLLNANQTRAVFWKALPLSTPDAELSAIAEELQRPIVIQTAELGEVIYDRPLDQFDGKIDWLGKSTPVSVSSLDAKPVQGALETAKALLASQQSWHQRILQKAVDELYLLWKENWKEDDALDLDAREFTLKMRLDSISFDDEGRFEFWFDDGGLFYGHSIMVDGNLQAGPVDAGIHG
jgi:hypothetical protein